jgi:hypothetical protein
VNPLAVDARAHFVNTVGFTKTARRTCLSAHFSGNMALQASSQGPTILSGRVCPSGRLPSSGDCSSQQLLTIWTLTWDASFQSEVNSRTDPVNF